MADLSRVHVEHFRRPFPWGVYIEGVFSGIAILAAALLAAERWMR